MNHQRKYYTPRRHPLGAALVAALLPMTVAAAPNVEFNADLLFGSASSTLDLARFEQGGILPGTYNADIFVNGTLVGREDLVARVGDGDTVFICLAPELFELMGLNLDKLEAARTSVEDGMPALLPLPEETACSALSTYIPGATIDFDAGEQALHISVPQLYLARNRRGWVPPALWEKGVTAATLGYSISHSQQRSASAERTSTSMTVDAGLNMGEWRLRHSGYLHHSEDTGIGYDAGRSVLQRNLPALGAQLSIGDASTSGDMLEPVNFRGVTVTTDPRMLPDDLREFAPVVRGVAQSNARVTVRQRGHVVHETTVAPGPFEIEDLVVSGASGDLEVEVTEADGRVESFTIPYTAMPQLLRPGQLRYSFTAGQLRDVSLQNEPRFIEVTLRRGMSNRLTGYAGITAAQGYSAAVVGAAWNTPMGAFSGDVTFSDARLPGTDQVSAERRRGQSYRLAYNKSLFSNSTNITMAAYRYSTSDFLSLGDAMRLRESGPQQAGYDLVGRQRSRLDLTVNQRLSERGGSLYFTGSTADYWSENRRQTSFSLGYSNRMGRANYTLSARRTLESSLFSGGAAKASNSIHLSVSMPLGGTPRAPRLDFNADRDSNGRGGQGLGVSGSVGDQWQGNYNASINRDERGARFGLGGSYQLPTTHVSGSYTRGGDSSHLLLAASGGVVLHGGGLTFSQRLGETVGVVHVPGAVGAGVGSLPGVKTDSRGYAIVPYLSPFRRNELAVDPTGLPMDVEVSAGSVSAIPSAGAVVKMVLPTTVGRNALIEALLPDGSALPFGADVVNAVGEAVGVVGQGSRLWVRGLDEQGELFVAYGAGEAKRCRIAYDLRNADASGVHLAACTPHAVGTLTARSE